MYFEGYPPYDTSSINTALQRGNKCYLYLDTEHCPKENEQKMNFTVVLLTCSFYILTRLWLRELEIKLHNRANLS